MIRIFEDLERFTCGTVGLPGERTFFIQARSTFANASLSIEKMQVAALAERLRYMVKEIKSSHPLTPINPVLRDNEPLETPIEEDFRIGSIAIFFDDLTGLIQVDLREFANESVESDLDDDEGDVEMLGDIEVVRLYIRVDQALTFADRADLLVGAGRLPCPFCGAPINPTGHLCARANGYRR